MLKIHIIDRQVGYFYFKKNNILRVRSWEYQTCFAFNAKGTNYSRVVFVYVSTTGNWYKLFNIFRDILIFIVLHASAAMIYKL